MRLSKLLFLLLLSIKSYAQLSKTHYLPPLFSLDQNTSLAKHKLFFSTNSETSFYVKLYEGKDKLIDSVELKKSSTVAYNLVLSKSIKGIFQSTKDLNKPLAEGGLMLKADYPFYVNLRTNAHAHGSSLSTKGKVALGKEFYTGHLYVGYKNGVHASICSNFISIMAEQNNTKVKLSNISKNVNFHGLEKGKTEHTFTLNKGESYIIAEIMSDVKAKMQNESFGTKINSSKPIAVNCGTFGGINPLGFNGWDNGVDQIVPVNAIGKEYILVRGQGIDELESPVIVATKDETKLYVNGEHICSLNQGEYHVIDGSFYTKQGNMHINSNENVYVYQSTAGSLETRTGSLNFVPPLSNCDNFHEVLVSDLDFLGSTVVLNTVTKVGADLEVIDSKKGIVIKKINTKKTNLDKRLSLDWVSNRFNIPLNVNDILIRSNSMVMVSLNYNSEALGAASYFSGFIPKPSLYAEKGQVGYYADGFLNLSVKNHQEYNVFKWYKDGKLIATTDIPHYKAVTDGLYHALCFSTICGHEDSTNTIKITPPIQLAQTEDQIIFKDTESNFEKIIKEDSLNSKMLTNINFKYDSEKVEDSSIYILEEIIDVLTKYQKVVIEIRAHTDCRGDENYNLILSQKRAEYVKEYMMSKGINKNRLIANGFGEQEPLELIQCDCEQVGSCTETHHLMNRRSEFVIINK